jgi:hypothetical protein
MNVAVMQLDLTPKPATNAAPVPPAASRVQAERGGRMLFAWTNTPPNPVYIPRGFQWNESIERLVTAPYALLPALDFRRYGYLLAYDEIAAMHPFIARALSPEAELVASEGEWMLFRSRLPTVPLTEPDSAPRRSGDTLGRRLDRILAGSDEATTPTK